VGTVKGGIPDVLLMSTFDSKLKTSTSMLAQVSWIFSGNLIIKCHKPSKLEDLEGPLNFRQPELREALAEPLCGRIQGRKLKITEVKVRVVESFSVLPLENNHHRQRNVFFCELAKIDHFMTKTKSR
jgi:hypothetical protein